MPAYMYGREVSQSDFFSTSFLARYSSSTLLGCYFNSWQAGRYPFIIQAWSLDFPWPFECDWGGKAHLSPQSIPSHLDLWGLKDAWSRFSGLFFFVRRYQLIQKWTKRRNIDEGERHHEKICQDLIVHQNLFCSAWFWSRDEKRILNKRSLHK